MFKMKKGLNDPFFLLGYLLNMKRPPASTKPFRLDENFFTSTVSTVNVSAANALAIANVKVSVASNVFIVFPPMNNLRPVGEGFSKS